MNESPRKLHINPGFEFDDKLTSMYSVPLKAFRNHSEEKSGHFDSDQRHLYDTLRPKKAIPAQGSNRALFALVIIVCLISLVALLLTLLMFFRIISPSKEGQYTDQCMSEKTINVCNHRAYKIVFGMLTVV